MTPPVGSARSRTYNIATSPLRPHYRCTIQFTLAASARAHNLQGCRRDVPCSDRRRKFVRVADYHRLPTSALAIGSTSGLSVSTVRDLGTFVDCDLVMRTYVWRTVSYCFAMLRQLRSIRYLVSVSVFQSLVTALVLCCVNYGNSTLVGLPIYLQRRLQSV